MPTSRAKKVIDINTGAIYSTVKEAALANGIIYSNLARWLKNEQEDKTTLKYL